MVQSFWIHFQHRRWRNDWLWLFWVNCPFNLDIVINCWENLKIIFSLSLVFPLRKHFNILFSEPELSSIWRVETTSSRVADQHVLPQLLHDTRYDPRRRTSALGLNDPSELFVELKDKVNFDLLLLCWTVKTTCVGAQRRSDWSESTMCLWAQINKEFVINDWKHRSIITIRQTLRQTREVIWELVLYQSFLLLTRCERLSVSLLSSFSLWVHSISSPSYKTYQLISIWTRYNPEVIFCWINPNKQKQPSHSWLCCDCSYR